jgi:hypothetical protein
MPRRPWLAVAIVAAVIVTGVIAGGPVPAGATTVNDESSFRAAFADVGETSIVLGADVALGCGAGWATRTSTTPVVIDGQGRFAITQTCPEVEALASFGSGSVTIRDLTLRGGLIGLFALGPVVLSGAHLTGQTSAVGSAFGVLTDGTATITDTVVDDLTAISNTIGIRAAGVTADGLRVANLSGDEVFGVISDGPLAASGIEVTGLRGGLAGSILVDRARYEVVGASVSGIVGTRIAYGLASSGVAGSISDSSFVGVTGGTGLGVWLVAGGSGLELRRSTIADVTGTFAVGVLSAGAVSTVNSTIADVGGPGIYAAGDVSLVYSTITGTGSSAPLPAVVAEGPAGGLGGVVGLVEEDFTRQVTSTTGALTLFGTVLADNAAGGANCQAVTLTSDGYNFADDTSCALTGPGDRQGGTLDPGLGPLGDHGGPGPTRVPGAGSPLVDAIPTAACRTGPAATVTTDERGLPRPALGGCDIGAVEVQPEPEPEPAPAPAFVG